MKTKILSLSFLLFAFASLLACRCMPTNIIDEFAQSDYIGEVKILKVNTNANFDTNYYEIEVEEIKTYKGKFSKIIRIQGSNDKRPYKLSCNRLVIANQKMMVYANTQEGHISVGFCGNSKSYTPENEKDLKMEVERIILNDLKKNEKLLMDSNRRVLQFNEYSNLETKVKLDNVEPGYFMYKVQLDTNNKPTKICAITKISKSNNKKIEAFLQTFDYKNLLFEDNNTTKKPFILINLYINNSNNIINLSDWRY